MADMLELELGEPSLTKKWEPDKWSEPEAASELLIFLCS